MFYRGALLLFLSARSSRKKGSVGKSTDRLLCQFFLNGYLSHTCIGVCGESPIHLVIGRSAVNVTSHHQFTILNNVSSIYELSSANTFSGTSFAGCARGHLTRGFLTLNSHSIWLFFAVQRSLVGKSLSQGKKLNRVASSLGSKSSRPFLVA